MRRLYEAMTGWGTVVGSVLLVVSLSVTLVVFAVRMEGEISYCKRAVDRLESHVDRLDTRLDSISENVAKTREEVAKIQGQLQPVKPLQTASDTPR
jgi:peptidoglycan hydrolase CwlO-like protein